MEHPLITIDPAATLDDLQSRITDLTKKLAIASRSGYAQLYHQIRLALDTYQSHYHERMKDIANKDRGTDYSDKIDIS